MSKNKSSEDLNEPSAKKIKAEPIHDKVTELLTEFQRAREAREEIFSNLKGSKEVEDLDLAAESYINKWKDLVKDSDVVVVTIGGNSSPSQLEPKFVQEAREAGKKISMLNIDPNFPFGKGLSLSQDNSELPIYYNLDEFEDSKYSKFDNAMDEAILEISKNKKVVLCSFTFPEGCSCFLNVNREKDNDNIEFIAGYFDDVGVMQLKPKAFEVLEIGNLSMLKSKELLKAGNFELPVESESKENTDEPQDVGGFFGFMAKPKSPEEYAERVKEYNRTHNDYAKFYDSIDSVKAADLGIDISKKEEKGESKTSSTETPATSIKPIDEVSVIKEVSSEQLK